MVDIFVQEKQVLVEPDDSLIYQQDDAMNKRLMNELKVYEGTQVTWVASTAFANCNSLVDCSLPNVIYFNDYAFNNCWGLERTNFPRLETIGSYCFNSCSVLKKMILPSIKTIKDGGFNSCARLTALILPNTSTVCTMTGAAFNYTPIAGNSSVSGVGRGYIYVPAALVDQYKTATNWSAYATQIRAIEDYPDIVAELVALGYWEVAA